MGALLDREPAGDFAHGREQRQAAVGPLDGLVGDGENPAGLERSNEIRHGCQVQIGEERLTLADPRDLFLDRLLDLEHKLGLVPHAGHIAELGARRRVLLVSKATAGARSSLDQHAVPGI